MLETVDLVVVLGVVVVVVEHVYQLLLALYILLHPHLPHRHLPLLLQHCLPAKTLEVLVFLDLVDGTAPQSHLGVLL